MKPLILTLFVTSILASFSCEKKVPPAYQGKTSTTFYGSMYWNDYHDPSILAYVKGDPGTITSEIGMDGVRPAHTVKLCKPESGEQCEKIKVVVSTNKFDGNVLLISENGRFYRTDIRPETARNNSFALLTATKSETQEMISNYELKYEDPEGAKEVLALIEASKN